MYVNILNGMSLVAETGMVVHKGCVEKAKDMQGKLCAIVYFLFKFIVIPDYTASQKKPPYPCPYFCRILIIFKILSLALSARKFQ